VALLEPLKIKIHACQEDKVTTTSPTSAIDTAKEEMLNLDEF